MIILKAKLLRVLPLLAIGALIFYANSSMHFNYMLRGYFVLMEIQATIFVLLLMTGKFAIKK
ncbi:MAG: hypothetical protein QNJ36_00580 [Calothrix sp. MO_167.B42]|nr:hypothetical protein [Calothrix sp. MO_167.B42]